MMLHGQPVTAGVLSHAAMARRRMRICHIVSGDLWAGAEVQVATVASYLAECPDVDLSAVVLNEGRLASELRQMGVRVAVIDESRNSALGILIFLIRFLRENQVEIVDTHRYKESVLGTIAAKLVGVPHVIRTVHGLNELMRGWKWAKLWVYEALEKVILWFCADRIIAVSSRTAETLKGSGYKPTAVVCIPAGVDLRNVKAIRPADEVRRELGIGPRMTLIGTAGRLSPVKGHGYLLRAAKQIVQKVSDVKFLFVGDGPLREELLASARDLGVNGECVFVGSRADVYDLVAAMDIFVLPSLDEGMPMALLEAMALGRPVVATAVGGIPEVVRHRATGLLVTPGDEQGLADACQELALNREWAQALGAHARRVVEQECSRERNGHAVVETYRRLLGARDASGDGGLKRSGERDGNLRRHGPAPVLWGVARRFVEWGRRKLDHAVARWRMSRIRRCPTALTAALRSAKSILIVCQGNIIRSAFAAGLLAQAIGDREPVCIASGGLEATPGDPPHPIALLAATGFRVDLSHHAAAPVTPESVAKSDVIFVMEIPHLVVMGRRFPRARAKTFLLTCLTPEAPLEIHDPNGGTESLFQVCFDYISQAVRPIAGILCDMR